MPDRLSTARIDDDGLFRTLFEANPDALLVVDGDGTVVLGNRSAAQLLGYSVEELIGLPVDALVPDSVRPRHAKLRAAYESDPVPRPMGLQTDLVARRKGGSEVRVEIALSPLRDHGRPLVVAAIRDIRAYPRVLQALKRARYSERLAGLGRLAVDLADTKALLDRVPVVAAEALESEFAMVYLLESNLAELGVASAVGVLAGEEPGNRLPNRPDTSIGFVLAHGRSVVVPDYRLEQRFSVPASYLDAGLVSALAVPLSDRGRTIGAVAVRSVRPKHFGDDEVRFLESLANLLASALQRAQSDEALNHAQRLESVGQLTGGIAHDFNNLLTVIQGNLQLLAELHGLADDENGRQLVESAARASRRGAELTGKLLAFSRRQVLQPTSVDVGAMVHSLVDMLRRTLDQRVRIEVDVEADCPAALADPGQLESALLNIAINARDAMPDGGTIRFRAAAMNRLPDSAAEVSEAATTGFVEITIADTGVGMTDEVKERVFEPFFTTKAPGRGTGLGLSTVYGFVKQSRGTIILESSPGAGTSFTLFIPREDARAASQNNDAWSSRGLPAGLRVLLVEDDPEVAAVVRQFFETLGSVVAVASSGEQALLALEPGVEIDLLVSDIALGAGIRGTELAARVQQRFPALRVLLMSGFAQDLLDADRSVPASWELLPKPFSRDELAQAAARALSSGRDPAQVTPGSEP